MVNLEELLNKKKSMKQVESTTITDVTGKRYQINLNDLESKPIEMKSSNGFVVDTTPDQISCKILIPDEIVSSNSDSSITSFNLYIGSQDCAINKDDLISKNIKSILNVGFGIKNLYTKEYNDKDLVIEYFNSEILDDLNFNIIDKFEECFKFIDNQMRNNIGLLCHCNAGISRSCTIIIGYLMYKFNISFLKSLEIVKLSRTQCNPNQGFKKQLENYEIILKK